MIRQAILRWAQNRAPDFIIGGHESPYMRRHWLLPRNRFFNVYVHQFLRSDDDRALHDHPWLFNASWLLDGQYTEHTIAEGGIEERTERRAGDWKFRWGRAPHRVELDGIPGICEADCWTVFVTGPVVREWGFHCPGRGWVSWRKFTAGNDRGAIGRGCS
jgi:hypothetical protein